MRLSIFAAGLLSLGLTISGCSTATDNGGGGSGSGGRTGSGGSGTGGSSSGTGGSASGTGGSASGTGGSSGGTGGSMGNDAGGGATATYADVKPIFMAKCNPCHSGTGAGSTAHKLAESETDATKTSYSCSGKTKGACTLIRIKAGTMPLSAGCKGDPAMDSGNPKCLTQAEQDKLQAWIDGGLK